MFRVRSVTRNPPPGKTTEGRFEIELTTRSGRARPTDPVAAHATAEAMSEPTSAAAAICNRMDEVFPVASGPKLALDRWGFRALVRRPFLAFVNPGFGGRLDRRVGGPVEGILGDLLFGLRLGLSLGDRDLRRSLFSGPGLFGFGFRSGFLFRGRLVERLQLLLRRQLSALRYHRQAERRRHVGEELDRDLVAADPLDRFGEVELAPVDPDPLRFPDPV